MGFVSPQEEMLEGDVDIGLWSKELTWPRSNGRGVPRTSGEEPPTTGAALDTDRFGRGGVSKSELCDLWFDVDLEPPSKVDALLAE